MLEVLTSEVFKFMIRHAVVEILRIFHGMNISVFNLSNHFAKLASHLIINVRSSIKTSLQVPFATHRRGNQRNDSWSIEEQLKQSKKPSAAIYRPSCNIVLPARTSTFLESNCRYKLGASP